MASKKVLSIEIGYSLTKVLEIDYKTKNPKVYSSFVLETPSDFFKDDIITDHPEFSKTFREKLEAMGIKTKNCIFTVSSSKIASREVPVPASVKENRIQSLVEMNAKDYFPIDLSGYRLTYSVLREHVKEGLEEKKYLLVLAAPQELLESYVRFAKTVGLETVALDYNGNSLYEAVKDTLITEEVKAFVKVDEKSSYCMIVKGKDVVFTRNLTYGIDDAIEEIIDNKAFEGINTYLDAVDVARSKTCIYSSYSLGDDEGKSDPQIMREAKKSVTDSFKMLTGGIARMLDYYKSKNQDDVIKVIYVTGIGADFSGLQKLIGAETGIDCKVYTHFDSIKFDKATKELPLGEYITCIGATIRPVGFVLSTEDELKEQKSQQGFSASAFLIFVGCLVISAALIVVALLPYNTAKSEKAFEEKRITMYSQAMDVYTAYVTEKASYDKLKHFSGSLDCNNNHIVEFIEEMEAKMPRSLLVSSLATTNDGATMSVTVDSMEAAAKLIEQFETFDMVQRVDVNSITLTTDESGAEICSFAVTITFNPVEMLSEE